MDPPSSFADRFCGEIDRGESSFPTSLRERDRLSTNAASNLEHRASRRIRGVVVEQVDQHSRLVVKALVFLRSVAVNISLARHRLLLSLSRARQS
jgi:hypothetical protein